MRTLRAERGARHPPARGGAQPAGGAVRGAPSGRSAPAASGVQSLNYKTGFVVCYLWRCLLLLCYIFVHFIIGIGR